MTGPPPGPAVALILVAHGTREPAGPVVLEELADDVRHRLPEVEVRLAYVDVIGPTLEDELARARGPVVLVPLFLASGYHVRVDIPDVLERSGAQARVTPALGPDAAVIAAVVERLGAAGPPPDAVVLAAAGSSDERALADVALAARRLSAVLGLPVSVGFAATASPTVAEAVADLRRTGNRRIGVASYLLAPGLFQRRLAEAGADVVAEPIGAHPLVADLIVERYRAG